MPDPTRPAPPMPPIPARPDAVRVVSDRLLARAAAWQGPPAVPPVAPEGRSVPDVESPLPATLAARDEATSSRPATIDPPAEPPPIVAAPAATPPTLTAPVVADPAGARDLVAARPAIVGGSVDQPEGPAVRGAGDMPLAFRPAGMGERAIGDPPGLDRFERPEPGAEAPSAPLPPPATSPARLPSALGLDPIGDARDVGPAVGLAPPSADDLPLVRPGRPDALAPAFVGLDPARSTPAPNGGDLASGSLPIDEEVFAAATGSGPGGGSGPMGMDLTRTNELLQQVIDAIRKRPAGSNSSLPGGGSAVYAERY